ncbi:hypothetical protein [Wolbachia endosymbiont (group B) of Erebia ligea]|uniref:hypothetical protein n=1 Tax=Wolbachia endosymbiont (group B) of Erebia ligea TaxID=2954010 RepID=UPI0021F8798D|nr:hypothetical protein [Wolbachia endosymbiont (group B) of Erebia ligea]
MQLENFFHNYKQIGFQQHVTIITTSGNRNYFHHSLYHDLRGMVKVVFAGNVQKSVSNREVK